MADLTPEARAQIAARVEAATAPPPRCRLCGDEMAPQYQTIGEVEFACPSRGLDGEWKQGRTLADQHYDASRRSRSLVCADPEEVAALLAHVEAQDAEVARLREESRQAHVMVGAFVAETAPELHNDVIARYRASEPGAVIADLAELAAQGEAWRKRALAAEERLEAVAEVRAALVERGRAARIGVDKNGKTTDTRRLAGMARGLEHAADLLGKALEG